MQETPESAPVTRRDSLWVRIPGFLMGVWLSLALLLGIIWVMGCTPEVMGKTMARHASAFGVTISEKDCGMISGHVAVYLRGSKDSFQLELYGQSLFTEREIRHMVDVQALFRLLEHVLLCGMVLFFVLVLVLRGRTKPCFRRGIWFAVGLLAAVALTMALDFRMFFTLFHYVLFTNDLWCLNPAESLLVRLMNTAFFTELSLLIVGVWAALLLGILLLTRKNAPRRPSLRLFTKETPDV